MGKKKSKSVLMPLSQILPLGFQQGLKDLLEDQSGLAGLFDSNEAAQVQIFYEVQQEWEIAAFWIAYEAMPIIDIHRTPYLKPEFKALRDWANTLSALLQLSKGCFELKRPKEYESPFHWWLECLKEIKSNHLLEALGSPGSSPKTDYIEEYKTCFLQELRKGQMPSILKDLPASSANVKLMQTAIYLVSHTKSIKISNAFRTDYFNPYIATCQRFIEKCRSNPMLVGRGIVDGEVYEVVKSHRHKTASLKTNHAPIPQWSSQRVYVQQE
jgi:hypothetical protein